MYSRRSILFFLWKRTRGNTKHFLQQCWLIYIYHSREKKKHFLISQDLLKAQSLPCIAYVSFLVSLTWTFAVFLWCLWVRVSRFPLQWQSSVQTGMPQCFYTVMMYSCIPCPFYSSTVLHNLYQLLFTFFFVILYGISNSKGLINLHHFYLGGNSW